MSRGSNIPFGQISPFAGPICLTLAAALGAALYVDEVTENRQRNSLLQASPAARAVHGSNQGAYDIRLARGNRISFRRSNGAECSVAFDPSSLHADGEAQKQTPEDVQLLDPPDIDCSR